MSILLYQNLNGKTVEVYNPTNADFTEAWRVFAVRNHDEIERETKQAIREWAKDSIFMKFLAR